jgi:hypothetical protein
MSVNAEVGSGMPVLREPVPKVLDAVWGYGILVTDCFKQATVVYPVGMDPLLAGEHPCPVRRARGEVIEDLEEAADELRSLAADLGAHGAAGDAVDRRGEGPVYCPATEASALARRCERLAGLLEQSPFPDAEVGAVFGHVAGSSMALFATLRTTHGDLLLRRWPGLAWEPPEPRNDS